MWFVSALNSCWNYILDWFSFLKDLIANNLMFLMFFSVITFVLSIVGCATLITLLPHDYFLESKVIHPIRNPILRFCVAILKNLIGLLLIIVGALLSLPGVPGQGLLTILSGLIISDFPGKKRLARRIIRMRAVYIGANKIRNRFNRQPFVLDED